MRCVSCIQQISILWTVRKCCRSDFLFRTPSVFQCTMLRLPVALFHPSLAVEGLELPVVEGGPFRGLGPDAFSTWLRSMESTPSRTFDEDAMICRSCGDIRFSPRLNANVIRLWRNTWVFVRSFPSPRKVSLTGMKSPFYPCLS